MTHRIVILGGGTGGTLTANRLRRLYSPRTKPRSPWSTRTTATSTSRVCCSCRSGLTHPEDIVRPRGRQLHDGIDFVQSRDRPRRHRGRRGPPRRWCDARLRRARRRDRRRVWCPRRPRASPARGGWTRCSRSTRPRAPPRLEAALATFDGGRLVVNVVDMPIKCPVAPLEFCFLADWYFHERGIRDQVADHAT